MEGVAGAESAAFFEVGGDFLVPVVEFGGTEGAFGGAGKDEIGHGEVADGTAVGGGVFVDGFGHAQGGFAHFEGGPVVAADGGVDFVFEDDRSVIAHAGGVGMGFGIVAEQQGENDKGIFFGNEAAAGAEAGDDTFGMVDFAAQFGVAGGGKSFDGELFFGGIERFEPEGEKRVLGFAFFGPFVARGGLVVGALVDRGAHVGHAVAIGSVGNDVHVTLNEQGAAFALGVGEFEDGFGVEEVVPVEDAVEAGEFALDPGGFEVVELVVEAGDFGTFEEAREAGEHFGKVLIDAGKLGQGVVRFGDADGELEVDGEGVLVEAFGAGIGALLGIQLGLNGDAVVEGGNVDLLAGDEIGGKRWRRGGDFFNDFHFLDDFAVDFPGDGDFFGDVAVDDFGGAGLFDEVVDAAFDAACVRSEGEDEQGEDNQQQQQAAESTEKAGAAFLPVFGNGKIVVVRNRRFFGAALVGRGSGIGIFGHDQCE